VSFARKSAVLDPVNDGPPLKVWVAVPEESWGRITVAAVNDMAYPEAHDMMQARPDLRLLGGPKITRYPGTGLANGFPTDYGCLALFRTAPR
jgi:hypothetical protein